MTTADDRPPRDGGGEAHVSAAPHMRKEGGRLADEAATAARGLASEYKGAAADYLGALAEAGRNGAEELERRGHGGSAAVVRGACEDFAGFAKTLAGRQPQDILHEVEGFARHRPALFFGAAMLMGFGAVRFLRSSSQHPPTQTSTDGGL